ncbi:hypothetical protein VQ056_24965 [Paenibacillus sp. JTLBN-2024]
MPLPWLLSQVGISQATAFAAKLGIDLPKEDRNLSIALGGLHAESPHLKMAQAYSVFASGGVFREAHMVRRIQDSKGNRGVRICSPGAASGFAADGRNE